MSAETADERPTFATQEEAATYWAAKLAEKTRSARERERLISLLLD